MLAGILAGCLLARSTLLSPPAKALLLLLYPLSPRPRSLSLSPSSTPVLDTRILLISMTCNQSVGRREGGGGGSERGWYSRGGEGYCHCHFPIHALLRFSAHPCTFTIFSLCYTYLALPANAMTPWLVAVGKESQPVGGLHPPLLRVEPSLKINEFCP
jgi:hypothetical protein